MQEDLDIDLGINPKRINETEARQLALVLNLLRNPAGLSFRKIRSQMSAFYNNPMEESDQKKIHRDIEELSSLGFSIKFFKSTTNSDNIYKIDVPVEEKKIQFATEELAALSVAILGHGDLHFSGELYTACQKIFHQNMQLFPFQSTRMRKNEKENSSTNQILLHLFKSIKNSIPLKIVYFKRTTDDKEEKEIDPIHITKRNNNDFYLIAYDRNLRQKRRYLIPKILKIQEIGGDFILPHKIVPEDLNYHALNFKVHDPIEVRLEINPGLIWKLENYLHPHPYRKETDTIIFTTTNQSALHSFLWKEPEAIKQIQPDELVHKYKDFLLDMKELYQ